MIEELFDKVKGEEAYSLLLNNSSNKWPTRNSKDCRLSPICSPTINPSFKLKEAEQIFTIGSCFARNVEVALKKSGHPVPCLEFTVPTEELWSGTKMQSGIINKYTPHSMLNEVMSAFGEEGAPKDEDYLIEVANGKYLDLQLHINKPVSFERAMERRGEVRELFKEGIGASRVCIITLGLVETWWDDHSRLYLNETPSRALIKMYPDRFFFEVLSPENVIDCTKKLIELIHKHSISDSKLLITVSPVPIKRTFTQNDVILANTYSKSTLRVAAEVVSRMYPYVDYYPSYESIVLSDPLESWEDDLLHVNNKMIYLNVSKMLKNYSN